MSIRLYVCPSGLGGNAIFLYKDEIKINNTYQIDSYIYMCRSIKQIKYKNNLVISGQMLLYIEKMEEETKTILINLTNIYVNDYEQKTNQIIRELFLRTYIKTALNFLICFLSAIYVYRSLVDILLCPLYLGFYLASPLQMYKIHI